MKLELAPILVLVAILVLIFVGFCVVQAVRTIIHDNQRH